MNEVPCPADPTKRQIRVLIEMSIDPAGDYLRTDTVVTISVTGNATCRSIIVRSFDVH